MRRSLLLVGLTALGATAALAVTGASMPPTNPPWVVDGEVNALAVARGKLFVGGGFRQIGSPTGPLVAFTLKGTRDPRFPSTDLREQDGFSGGSPVGGSSVNAVISDGQGGLYVGGSFNTLGGVACRSLAHILRGGKVDRGFCPRPSGPVRALSWLGSRLYVGGEFSRIAGVARKGLAALDVPSGRATPFRLTDGASVWQLEATPDAIYARTGCDTLDAFNPSSGNRLPFAPKADGDCHYGNVRGFAAAARRVYAWGRYHHIGGKACGGLAVVDARSGDQITCYGSIAVDAGIVSGGVLYLSGGFKSVDGQPRAGLAALAADTGRLLPWRAHGLPAGFRPLTVAGGVLYLAGPASSDRHADLVIAARSARTGAAVPFSSPRFSGISTIALIGNRVVVGGGFQTVNAATHGNLLAVDAASGRPLPWQAGIPEASVDHLAVTGSTLYVTGTFDRAGGQPRNSLAAFDAGTGKVLPWQPRLGEYPGAFGLAATPDGVYTALDRFRLVELDPHTGALRQTLETDGCDVLAVSGGLLYYATWKGQQVSLAAADTKPLRTAATLPFTVRAVPVSQSLAADARGVYMGGAFRQLPGLKQPYLARLRLENGALRVDSSWRPRLPGPVLGLTLDGDTVIAAGLTRNESRLYAVVVDSDSGRTTTLGNRPAESVMTLAVAASDHNVYVGGAFGVQRFRR